MLVFALVGLVGIVLLLISILCGIKPDTKCSGGAATIFIIGIALMVIGCTGGLVIRDIEEDAIRQEYQYEYNYCPHCGERLKEN